jgi:hypothetical protein
LPKTEEAGERSPKVRGQARPAVFLLENITYLFDWPDSKLSDAQFST